MFCAGDCCIPNEVGSFLKRGDVFRIQPLDGGATPDSGWGLLEVEVERGVGITGRYERFGDV